MSNQKIKIFPFATSVVPLSHDKTKILEAVSSITVRSETYEEQLNARYGKTKEIFIGQIHEDSFRIWRRGTYPQFFIPLIKGDIDNTSNGSVLQLNFSLLPGTKFLFYLFSFVSAFVAIFFLLHPVKYHYGIISLVFFALNYLVVVANFNIHVRDSKKALTTLFEAIE